MAAAAGELPRRGCRGDRDRRAPPRPQSRARGTGGGGVAAARALRRLPRRRRCADLHARTRRGHSFVSGALAGAARARAARRRYWRKRAGQPSRNERQSSQLAKAPCLAHRGYRGGKRHEPARRAARCGAPAGGARSIGMSEPGSAFSAVRATYRLQFHKGFTFRDAATLVSYLARLGISHIYASPLMEARPGSTHGYDIVHHNRFNPEIGSEDEFAALVAALKAHGMGLILDIVPNHMAVGGADNAWWLDVLEWGEASLYAPYFDINWDPLREDLK